MYFRLLRSQLNDKKIITGNVKTFLFYSERDVLQGQARTRADQQYLITS